MQVPRHTLSTVLHSGQMLVQVVEETMVLRSDLFNYCHLLGAATMLVYCSQDCMQLMILQRSTNIQHLPSAEEVPYAVELSVHANVPVLARYERSLSRYRMVV